MSGFTVTIPGAPAAINSAYRIREYGARCPACGRGKPGLAKSEGTEAWQTEVAWLTKMARPKGWAPARRVIIEMDFYMNREGRDGDGPTKPCLDAVAEGLGVDDRIFLGRVMLNEVDRAAPRTIIRIENAE